ncbi:SMI1/KNR4 family protein [Aquimarina sp. 2201CG1-2-11]|uniref:SMI1/KNR4 family protein n=1 Tax=Aquimarina discodermiae TaxID=3231043 RepID=UPI00346183F7
MLLNFDVIGERTIVDIDTIQKMVNFKIPESYVRFLKYYGYGVISEKVEYLNIVTPDKQFFENNFMEYIDEWEWKNDTQKSSIQNSFLVAHTFDGEHVYCTVSSFIILPRFNDPIEFYDFEEVLQHYIHKYQMNTIIKYKPHKGY